MYNFIYQNPDPSYNYPTEVIGDVSSMLSMLATLIAQGGTEHFTEQDTNGLEIFLYGSRNLLDEAVNECHKLIHKPYAEGLKEGRAYANEEYRRGFAEGLNKSGGSSGNEELETVTNNRSANAEVMERVFKETVKSKEAETSPSSNEELQTSTENNSSYPRVPDLSVKQQMVASTYRRGHDVKEIAKAVNLKASSVEHMINELKEKGVLEEPAQDETTSKVANG